MDPLSSLLTQLRPFAHQAGRFDLGCKQSVNFPPYEGIKCYVVIEGQCWISLDSAVDATVLERGDCFLLSDGSGFRLEAEPGSPAIAMSDLIAAMGKGLPGLYSGEPACTLAGGHFVFEGVAVELFTELLPSIVVLRKSKRSTSMRVTLERMREELMTEQPGGSFLVQQLAYLMLVDAVRSHLADAGQASVGWLYAMSDRQLLPALRSIHDTPSKDWTLDSLAQQVGMSRSLFAKRFREKVGESPIDHLTRWRMMRAGEQLLSTRTPVLEIANTFGYQSESSFGKAYKRVTGYSPRQHRFARTEAADHTSELAAF